MDDPDSIRQFFGNGKLVGGEKYRHSLLRSLLEDVLDDPCVLWIQTYHRLIDHKHLGIMEEGRSNGNALSGAMERPSMDLLRNGSR